MTDEATRTAEISVVPREIWGKHPVFVQLSERPKIAHLITSTTCFIGEVTGDDEQGIEPAVARLADYLNTLPGKDSWLVYALLRRINLPEKNCRIVSELDPFNRFGSPSDSAKAFKQLTDAPPATAAPQPALVFMYVDVQDVKLRDELMDRSAQLRRRVEQKDAES